MQFPEACLSRSILDCLERFVVASPSMPLYKTLYGFPLNFVFLALFTGLLTENLEGLGVEG